MIEGGLITKWTQDEILKEKKNTATEEDDPAQERGPGALSLDHLQSAFYLLVLGYSSAMIALTIEMVFFKCKN